MIDKVLMAMTGKGMDELKGILYCVLSGYDIAERSTELQKVDDSWEKELQAFLVRKRVEGRSERTLW